MENTAIIKTNELKGGMYMNLVNYPHKTTSISQFEQARCYELLGMEYILIMDGGYDYKLSFPSKDACKWGIVGQEMNTSRWFCLKADDETFYVTVQVGDLEQHVYVLDFAQRLVTRLVSKKGLNPKHPYIITNVFDFGAIDMKGYPLPFKRHGFTSDLIGTTVRWRWSMELYTKHAYHDAYYYRITWDDDGAAADDFGATNEMLPSTDEHARYVKIKENMYLFTLSEEHEERALGDIQQFRANIHCMLQNYDRMYEVGSAFGTVIHDGKLVTLSIGLTAYGKPVELPERFLEAPNPFIV